MRTLATWFAVMLTMALGGRAWTALAKTNEVPQLIRLELDLIDGSHIIGVPTIESAPLQTPYATMNVPLRQILTLRIDANHETSSLDLRTGDKLKGVVNLDSITLDTVFGKVAVGIEHIRELGVTLGGRTLPEALRQKLVLYYNFDKDEGARIPDGSGSGHAGTCRGVTWSPKGVRGGACAFDGNNSHIEVPHAPGLRFQKDPFTVAFWLCPQKVERQYAQTLIAKYATDSKREWLIDLSPTGELRFDTSETGAGGDRVCTAVSGRMEPGRWCHVAVVKSGERVLFFVDGQNVADDGTPIHAVLAAGDEPLRIGAYRPGLGVVGGIHSYSGLMDEILIIRQALTAAEVIELCHGQNAEPANTPPRTRNPKEEEAP